jgi:iron(III) transport system permease protein
MSRVAPRIGGATRRREQPLPAILWLIALAIMTAMIVPVLYLLVVVADLGRDGIRAVLTDPFTWRLVGRTVNLGITVTLASIALSVPVAWITIRSDLPARRVFAIATALPLVIPTYVGAFALVAAFARGGLAENWFGITGVNPYGYVGASLVLTVFSYPYLLLTVQAALRGMEPSLEEASNLLGYGNWQTFLRVTLPQLRLPVAAGSLLVTLYVFSDFGAVSILRYQTLTRGLYLQYTASFNRASAAMLGLLLVGLTVIVIGAEARLSSRFAQRGGGGAANRSLPVVPLGRWRIPALLLSSTVVVVGVITPVVVIVYWLTRGIAAGQPLYLPFGPAWRSILTATLAAGATVVAALPVAILAARSRTTAAQWVARLSYTGYALPGVVVALALVFVGLRVVPALYQTLTMLVFAYVVLFLPQAIAAIRTPLLQQPADLEAASRTLGKGRLATFGRITVPLARRGALAGGALVFLTTLKELPATLLLAPTGFDTLATRIWSETAERFLTRAASSALFLIVIGSVPLAILMVRDRRETLNDPR